MLLGGAAVGGLMGALVLSGNPPNMGICGACFTRDIAGALGLHSAAHLSYLRPEVFGVVLGALAMSVLRREFRSCGGGAPMFSFLLGGWVAVGALVFLGCPFRALQRLGGGDLNALVGIAGLLVGIAGAMMLMRRRFSLGRARPQPLAAGLLMPLVCLVLLAALVGRPTGLRLGETGLAAQHAPLWLSLGAALVAGALLQRMRFCTLGAFRSAMFHRDGALLGTALALVAAYGATLAAGGKFYLGFSNQPIAHSCGLWNFLAMILVGLAASMAGGCPVRLFVRSGEGDGDAALAVAGMIVGGALAHNFGLASSPAGPTTAGSVAVVAGIGFCVAVGFAARNTKDSAHV